MSACHYLPSCRHLLVKWFGVCLAVASGLAVGPEGPMIFIGTDLSHSALAAALHGRGLIRVCRGASIGYFFSRLRVIQIFGVDRLHQIEWIRILPCWQCFSFALCKVATASHCLAMAGHSAGNSGSWPRTVLHGPAAHHSFVWQVTMCLRATTHRLVLLVELLRLFEHQ